MHVKHFSRSFGTTLCTSFHVFINSHQQAPAVQLNQFAPERPANYIAIEPGFLASFLMENRPFSFSITAWCKVLLEPGDRCFRGLYSSGGSMRMSAKLSPVSRLRSTS